MARIAGDTRRKGHAMIRAAARLAIVLIDLALLHIASWTLFGAALTWATVLRIFENRE